MSSKVETPEPPAQPIQKTYQQWWSILSLVWAFLVVGVPGLLDSLEAVSDWMNIGEIGLLMMFLAPLLVAVLVATFWTRKVGNTYANYTRGLSAIGRQFIGEVRHPKTKDWMPFPLPEGPIIDLGSGDLAKLYGKDAKTMAKVGEMSGVVGVTGGPLKKRREVVDWLNTFFSGNGRVFVALYPEVESAATELSVMGNVLFTMLIRLFAIGSTDGHVGNTPVTKIGVKVKIPVADAVLKVISSLPFCFGLWLGGSFTFLFLNAHPELEGEKTFIVYNRWQLIAFLEDMLEFSHDSVVKHNAGILLAVVKRCWWLQVFYVGSRK